MGFFDFLGMGGSANPKAATAMVQVNGMTFELTGAIDHDRWQAGQMAGARLGGIPGSVAEFEQIRRVLGAEPHGAVALQVLAFAAMNADPAAGEAMLRLNNTDVNARSCVERLRELVLRADPYYSRPYLVATFFDGATAANGYTPSRPYTLKIRSSVNTAYQASQLLRGTVLSLDVYSAGYDTPWRGVQVVRPAGSEFYVVSNCPAMYTQCKEIAAGSVFKGL